MHSRWPASQPRGEGRVQGGWGGWAAKMERASRRAAAVSIVPRAGVFAFSIAQIASSVLSVVSAVQTMR